MKKGRALALAVKPIARGAGLASRPAARFFQSTGAAALRVARPAAGGSTRNPPPAQRSYYHAATYPGSGKLPTGPMTAFNG